MCTEPWSLVLSINFLYVRHQNNSKWQLNQYHFMMNLFIVKRAGRALFRHQDDGYDSSLNKLPPFLNIKIKLGQIEFKWLNQNMFLSYRQKSSSNNRQFFRRGMFHIPWHQLISNSSLQSRSPASRFLCPRPPIYLSAPNHNCHATQANQARGEIHFKLLILVI